MEGSVWATLMLLVLVRTGTSAQGSEHAYLGEEPPGRTPEVFGKGVISTEANIELGITISPDGKEIFFTRRPKGTGQTNRLMFLRFEGGRWTTPAPAPFTSDHQDLEPNFSPDGRKIYFNSRRPLPADVRTGHELNVWVVARAEAGWGVPAVLGPPVSDIWPMFVTETASGSIYTTGNTVRGIYKSEFRDGRFQVPVYLPEEVNGQNAAGHPYIAPDESYLVFDANMDAQGNKNLFVSFRRAEGRWSRAINVSDHYKLPEHSWCPFVSFDGKYFFFCAFSDVYWVDAKIVKELGDQTR